MKKFSKIIKGILLTVLAIGVFCLNTGHVAQKIDPEFVSIFEVRSSILNQSQHQSFAFSQNTANDYFFSKAFAANSAGNPPASAPAAGTSNSQLDPKDVKTSEEMVQKVAKNSQLIFQLFQPAIFFFTKYISLFLGTDFVFGGKMGEMLHGIWVICRNIVNIVFVLILLFLAIKHIFGKDENTSIIKVLPSFALMLIAVNFSWLASRLIVDAANVATNVVFAIPNGIGGVVDLTGIDTGKCTISPDGSTLISYNCSPTSIYYPFDAVNAINMTEKQCAGSEPVPSTYIGDYSKISKGGVNEGYKKAYEGAKNTAGDYVPDVKSPFYRTATYCWKDLKIGGFNGSNAAYQLTYSMARVTNLPNATGKSIPKLVIGTIFALFIEVVYLVSFAALTIVLIFRAAFLWLFVSISPIIVLMMFLTKNEGMKGLTGGAESFLSIETFASWAFAPVKVAAVWTIGFIMITTGQVATNDLFTKFNAQSTVAGNVFQVSSAFMGMNSLQEMIWLIMTIVIIWMGTMAALKNLEGAKGVVGWIEKQGTAVSGLIKSVPGALPIIPTIDLDKGKLDFNNRMKLNEISPDKLVARAEKFMGTEGAGDARAFAKAESALKKRGEPGRKELRELQDGGKGKLFEHMKTHTGISEDAIKNTSEENIKSMFRGVGLTDGEAGKLATQLKNDVGGATGPLNPAVTVPTDKKPTFTPADITLAMREALRTQPVQIQGGKTVDFDNLSDKWQKALTEKAQKLATEKNLNKNEAIQEAIKALRTEIGNDTKATKESSAEGGGKGGKKE